MASAPVQTRVSGATPRLPQAAAGLGAHHYSRPEGLADFLAANGLLPA